jgi:hypothetical protein
MVGFDVAPMVVAGAMAAGTMAGAVAGACAITADAGATACAAMVEPPAIAACIAGCIISGLSGREGLQAEKVNGMVARTTNTRFMGDLLGGWVSC